ncbi:MAG TPA: beta-L-arabinofuranosidase domain-containing protein [Bacteroidales bacterium]|nr:beta-L-arabinofuranosidase domain-containing protein [Bacteroidales bacterium]
MRKILVVLTVCASFFFLKCGADKHESFYPGEFQLRDVTLLDGPFKHARDLNIVTLLQYDVDRLLAPFLIEAGLPPKAELYPNWKGLDGHIAGHYLSAMAMNYASTGNEECGRRLEYIISELKACVEANSKSNPDWGVGYIGGVPDSKTIWSTLKQGDFKAYRSAWVPWYNVHKMYAGLRDAWYYTENDEAKDLFLQFCNWGISITSGLSDEQMQSMLDTEHGGMNEIFADAFRMTGDKKYMDAAMRFSHRMLLDAMSKGIDNLDNKHANTQVPKAIGFQRVGELSGNSQYIDAGKFFWTTVTGNRTLAFGGNSRREYFPSEASCVDFVHDVEGPESCNTYNMLRLTEGLFRIQPSAEYADFFEKALFNHILSTQHPEHGGYVYFTPARPQHYRVYSAPNEGMWCCVGSGMENHGKYNQFIYTHKGDSLFVNLFIASELNWRDKGIRIEQQTSFPSEEKTTLLFTKASSEFTLLIRYPSWIDPGKMEIAINGSPVEFENQPSSYIALNRDWKKGDEVSISLPMNNTIENLPNVPEYVAFMHGPILLAARTSSEDMTGLIADDGRWAHIASGRKIPLATSPVLVAEEQSSLPSKLLPVEGKPLTFSMNNIKMANRSDLILEPFSGIHDSRYIIYWMSLNESDFKSYIDSLAVIEKKTLALDNRTIDFVAPGEQQPEVDHLIERQNSNSGNTLDQSWRDARNGFFSYNLKTNSETRLNLYVKYIGSERGSRKFKIFVDDKLLVEQDNTARWKQNTFNEVEYNIPDSFILQKENIRIKFESDSGSSVSSVAYVRLVKR